MISQSERKTIITIANKIQEDRFHKMRTKKINNNGSWNIIKLSWLIVIIIILQLIFLI